MFFFSSAKGRFKIPSKKRPLVRSSRCKNYLTAILDKRSMFLMVIPFKHRMFGPTLHKYALALLFIITLSVFAQFNEIPFTIGDMVSRTVRNKSYLLGDLFGNVPDKIIHQTDFYRQLQSPMVFNLNGGVPTKMWHSHNDEWRGIPLWNALRNGVVSVEADIHCIEDLGIMVGHNKASLSKHMTLSKMYLRYIEALLDEQSVLFPSNGTDFHGVYYQNPAQTMYLVLDLKRKNDELNYKMLLEELKPLRNKNYLSYLKDGEVIYRQVTVIISGHLPVLQMLEDNERFMFLDMPIDKFLKDAHSGELVSLNAMQNLKDMYISNKLALVGSSSVVRLTGKKTRKHDTFTENQLKKIKMVTEVSHQMGLPIRVWDTPSTPEAWASLIDIVGVDFLNLDELKKAKHWLEKRELPEHWDYK